MKPYHPNTIAVHSALAHTSLPNRHGAVNTEIQLSSTFRQSRPGEPVGEFEYSRGGNPTRQALEYTLARLEGAEYALAYSSGLAAVDAVACLLVPEQKLVCVRDVYGGTRRYFNRIAAQRNIGLVFDDMMPIDETTGMVWIESPTNPSLTVHDIRLISESAHRVGAIVVVDNTFMSPIFQNPLALGADIVLHSLTKYINGHSDVVAGAVMTSSDEMYEKMRFHQCALGAVPGPIDCYLIQRGIKTLPLRMERHQTNAMQVAQFLENHPMFKGVTYPGLASHPQHEIAVHQTVGHGGIVTVYYEGPDLDGFLNQLQLFTLAESLGAVESLVNVPAKMTHASVPEGEREAIGITDRMLRFSVGTEAIDDLINDLEQAIGFVTDK